MARQIGARLKKLREVSRLSLDYAAKSVGISKQTLFKYENDKITNIPSDKIKDLARLYQTSPAYIMGWEDDPSVKKKKLMKITPLQYRLCLSLPQIL